MYSQDAEHINYSTADAPSRAYMNCIAWRYIQSLYVLLCMYTALSVELCVHADGNSLGRYHVTEYL